MKDSFVLGRFMYWPPWAVTRPWLPRAFLGGDEWHNPSWALVAPFLGCFIWFRMDHKRVHGQEHLYAYQNGQFEGLFVEGCEQCEWFRREVLAGR